MYEESQRKAEEEETRRVAEEETRRVAEEQAQRRAAEKADAAKALAAEKAKALAAEEKLAEKAAAPKAGGGWLRCLQCVAPAPAEAPHMPRGATPRGMPEGVDKTTTDPEFKLFISHATKDDSHDVFKVVQSYMFAKDVTMFNPTTHLSHVEEINKAAMQGAVKRSSLVVAALSDGFFESSWCAAEIAAAKEAGIKAIPVYSGDHHGANQIDRWVKEFKGLTSDRAKKFPEFAYVFNENGRDVLNKQNPASTKATLDYLSTKIA